MRTKIKLWSTADEHVQHLVVDPRQLNCFMTLTRHVFYQALITTKEVEFFVIWK